MATFTTNYDFIKPGTEDYYDIADFNENMDAIDGQLSLTEQEVTKVKEELEQMKIDIEQACDLSAIDKKIGNTSDQTNTTLFGAIAAHKKATDTTDTKVGTSSDQTNSTLFGAIAAHKKATDATNTKVGTSSDQTNSTLFGAIAAHKKATDATNTKVGTSSDQSNSTLFGAIATHKKATDAMDKKIGTSGDNTTTTLFGLFNKINSKINSENTRYDYNTSSPQVSYENIQLTAPDHNTFKLHTFKAKYDGNIRVKTYAYGKAQNLYFYIMDLAPTDLMNVADKAPISSILLPDTATYKQLLYNDTSRVESCSIDIILPVIKGHIYHFLTSGSLYTNNAIKYFQLYYTETII